MKLFWALFILDCVIAVVLALILGIGVLDAVASRHVDRDDLLLWPAGIVGVASVLGSAAWLKSRRRLRAATGVLSIMAVPGVIAGLFVLLVLVELSKPGALR